MDCEPRAESFRLRLRRQAVKDGVPLTGMLELTRRCTFRCPHCYAGPALSAEGELSTAAWKRLLDEAAAAGCLELVLTGGEPLLRADFAELYVHARRKGLEVTVFTNASLIDGKAADLFREWPPFSVEVSVYGLTEPTARVVTGVEDACEAQWAGVRRLKEAGVPVTLKVLAIRPIRHEIEAIEERARREGLKLRLTTELTPRLDGDAAPLALRLDPEDAVALEAREPGWAESLKARLASRAGADRHYPCAAGQYGFFIDAAGWLQPCLAIRALRRNVGEGGLLEAWRAVVQEARGRQLAVDKKPSDRLLYNCFMCIGLNEWGVGRSFRNWLERVANLRISRVS
jgi:MoaA/NifB/PqqE/SkfB family radical SAM enzyme